MVFDLSWKRFRGGEAGPALFLRLAACAVWLAAVLVLAQTALRSRETPVRIRSRLADLNALAGQEARLMAWQSAADSFKKSAHPERPFDLPARAVQVTGATETNQVRETARTRLSDGWEAVRVQVCAASMPLAALSPLIEEGESADPPWRVTAFSVEPLSPKPGKGRVQLEFETLVRSKAAD